MFIWFLPIYSHLLLIFHKQTVFWCHHICSSNSFSTHSNGESQPQAVAWGAHRDLPQVVRTISRVGEAIPWGWFMALCLPRYMNWMDLVRVYSAIVGILKNQWWLAIWYSVGTLDSWYIYIYQKDVIQFPYDSFTTEGDWRAATIQLGQPSLPQSFAATVEFWVVEVVKNTC